MVDVLSRAPGFAADDVVSIPPQEVAFRVDGHELHKNPTSVQNKACRTYVNATRCAMEWDMWLIVRALVRPRHSVIEFGARYGTTSCMIAAAKQNSGRVVAVEPDPSAHAPLLHNRDSHKCNFHVVRGTTSAAAGLRMATLIQWRPIGRAAMRQLNIVLSQCPTYYTRTSSPHLVYRLTSPCSTVRAALSRSSLSHRHHGHR